MNRRAVGYLGLATVALFWCALLIFGALRPNYSHVVDTISELGAADTPYSFLWNMIGFEFFGVLLAFVGAIIAREVIQTPSVLRAVATALLAIAGLAVAGQGLFPAEMVDGVAAVTSSSTRAHFVSSLISGAAWILGAFVLVRPMSRNPDWQGLRVVSVVLVVFVFVASLTLRGVLPDGLAQRIGSVFFCLWYVVMSVQLLSLGGASQSA